MEDEESFPQQFTGRQRGQERPVPLPYRSSQIEARVAISRWQAVRGPFVWRWKLRWSNCYCQNWSRLPRGSYSQPIYWPTPIGGASRVPSSKEPYRPQDETAWCLVKLLLTALDAAYWSLVWWSDWGVSRVPAVRTGDSFGNPCRSTESSGHGPSPSAKRVPGEHHQVDVRSSWLQVHRPPE